MMLHILNYSFIVATSNDQSCCAFQPSAGLYCKRDIFLALVPIKTRDNNITLFWLKTEQISDTLLLLKLAKVQCWVQHLWSSVATELLNQLERIFVDALGVFTINYCHCGERCCNFFDQV